MRKLIFLFILMLTVGVATKAADVTFKASAPQAVVMGEQFRLTFTVNAEGKDLRVQEMPDFDVLMGPSQSTSYSSSWVNGKSTSETTVTYTYVLMPKKEGTFNIAPATIKVNGSNYTSNGLAIKVLPADKAGKQEAETTTASGAISNDRLFVKMDVSKRSVFEQEGFLVTFKVYSLENFSITGLKYPEFEGFLVQEVELPQEKQLTLENYNGRNYQSAVMRQVILYPQRSGTFLPHPLSSEALLSYLQVQAQIRLHPQLLSEDLFLSEPLLAYDRFPHKYEVSPEKKSLLPERS